MKWEIPDKINLKAIRLYRTQNSFTDYSLIYETSNSIERYLDLEVQGKRPYFYSIQAESISGEIFSSVVDAPPFAKAYIDQNRLPVLSKIENKIVNYHYSNIEQLHDNILKYIISDLIVSADTSQLYIIQSMLQHKDDVSSWMEYIGFQSHNIYQQFLTDEYLYGIRDQLENVLLVIF